MTQILEGKAARDFYKANLTKRVRELPCVPRLALIQVGDNPESNIYIEQKKKFAKSIGAEVEHMRLEEAVPPEEVAKAISAQNGKKDIHGIIVQLPLPGRFDKERVMNEISPEKDVDGLTDENQMLLEEGRPRFVPATPKGVSLLLDYYGIGVKGAKAVVMGRSRLVGKPLALLLKSKGAHVSVCHSKTENSREIAKEADMLFVAIGKPALIDSSYVKDGAVVIDIGINSLRGAKLEEEIPKRRIVGDVRFDSVVEKARAISPVPGGVGPMTVLSLFDNLILSAERSCRT